jgi:hypothetical protein
VRVKVSLIRYLSFLKCSCQSAKYIIENPLLAVKVKIAASISRYASAHVHYVHIQELCSQNLLMGDEGSLCTCGEVLSVRM